MSSGYLKLILGPMFSGKTSELIALYRRYIRSGRKVMVINYAGDTRYSATDLSTHDKQMIHCFMLNQLKDVYKSDLYKDNDNNDRPIMDVFYDSDVILINEGQFFDDIVDTVLEWIENHNKKVYICGLDGDSNRNLFGKLYSLIPYADDIVKLNSICASCKNGTPAPFTKRIIDNTNGAIIQIGSDEYMPVCRKCYNNTANLFAL
jgi:thymidine kinase